MFQKILHLKFSKFYNDIIKHFYPHITLNLELSLKIENFKSSKRIEICLSKSLIDVNG